MSDPVREAVLDVRDAIREPGPFPRIHEQVVTESRRAWRTLWDRLDVLLAALDAAEAEVPHGTSSPQLSEAPSHACEFCGFESDEEAWFSTYPRPFYRAKEPNIPDEWTLCRFCMNSVTVSSWTAGLDRDYDLAKDVAHALNLARANPYGR